MACPVGAVRRGRGPARTGGWSSATGRTGGSGCSSRPRRRPVSARRVSSSGGTCCATAVTRSPTTSSYGWTRPARTPRWTGCCAASDDPTRVEGSARWYARFTRPRCGSLRGRARVLDDPADLAGAVRQAAVPRACSTRPGSRCRRRRPRAPRRAGARLGRRAGADGRSTGMPRVFVKPAHGSSASGVLAVETAAPRPGQGDHLGGARRRTGGCSTRCGCGATRRARGRRASSTRSRPTGCTSSAGCPRRRAAAGPPTCGSWSSAGRATHAVVRTSRSPMTNLHLGGARGDLDVRVRLSTRRATAGGEALDLCERAAACFPGTLCVGRGPAARRPAGGGSPSARSTRSAICCPG